MARYVLHHLILTTLPTLLLLALVTFAITRVFIPADLKPLMIDEYGPRNQPYGASVRGRIESEVGLHRDTPKQFAQWLGLTWPFDGETGMLQGDFGTSLAARTPGTTVTSLVLNRLPATIELAVLAQVIALGVGLPVGLVSGLNRGKWPDRLIGAVSRLGAYPTAILAIQVIVLSGAWFNWSPPRWYYSLWEDPLQNLKVLFLPGLFMALMTMGILTRLIRRQVLEVLDDPSPGTNVHWWDRVRALKDTHVRAALVPIVLASGMSLQLLLGVTILYEQIFIVPGIGRLAVDATNNLDYPVLSGQIMILAAILLLITRIAELISAWLMAEPMRRSPASPYVRLWRDMYGASRS